MTIQQREAVYAKYIAQFPTLSNAALAEKILTHYTEDQLGVIKSTIAKQIAIYKRKTTQVEPDEALTEEDTIPIFFEDEDGPKWRVNAEHYRWETARGDISFPVAMIDQLFYDYSEYGMNITQTEIINKYNLKVWQWHSIKRVLELYKKSNIFSPHTVLNTPPEQLQQLIKDKMEGLTANIGYQVVQQYNKAIIKSYKQSLKEDAGKKLERETLLGELQDLIPQAIKDIRPRLSIAPIDKDQSKILAAFLFDIHYGAETRDRQEHRAVFSRADRKHQDLMKVLHELPDYSPEKCEEMLDKIAETINADRAKEVHLFFGGDNIETFTGMNHTDSWKGIAKGYYGSQLVVKAYKALSKFLSKINNLKSIHAVPGNHDRATEKSESDGQGYIAEIIFELLKLSFPQIPINYQEKVVSEYIDGIQYIMSHGHLKLTNLNPADLVLEYGDQGCFNMLLSGHLHSRHTRKDSKNFRHLVCPALFPGNDYSVNNGWHSCPGFLRAFNDGCGVPTIIDSPL